MKVVFTLFLCSLFVFCGQQTGHAQQLEIGVKAGMSVYDGDLSPREFGLFLEDMNFAGGLYLRYRPRPRYGIRVNGNFGRLSAEREFVAPNELRQPVTIERNFRSSISEFNAVLEYDLFYIGDKESNFLAGYIYGGIGVLSFNPEGTLDGSEYVELQPLSTEGQGSGANPAYDATPYELTTVTGILGGGFRVRFADRIVVGVEVGGRKPGTDYLDDISSTQINYLDILSQQPNGGLAARFSNPAVQNVSEVDNLSYKRGGEFEDYYFVGSVTLGITIGAPGSNKSGCYKF